MKLVVPGMWNLVQAYIISIHTSNKTVYNCAKCIYICNVACFSHLGHHQDAHANYFICYTGQHVHFQVMSMCDYFSNIIYAMLVLLHPVTCQCAVKRNILRSIKMSFSQCWYPWSCYKCQFIQSDVHSVGGPSIDTAVPWRILCSHQYIFS
jgi:hypothetical protein